MKYITMQGYAKVNLCLDITGQREDGYHLLETVMQSISLSDTVHIRTLETPEIQLACTNPDVPCDATNTAFRAAELFLKHHNLQCGIAIGIEKRIPTQAGLAGGSADAAAILAGLSCLFETGDSMQALCELGVKIGADVPFCLQGGTKFATGIGEILQPLPPLPSCCMVLCKPPVDVSTKLAYERIDQNKLPTHPDIPAMLQAFQKADLLQIARLLGNVFEAALELPDVAAVRTLMLQAGALGACMSGSGSSVFGIFQSNTQALDCLTALQKEYPLTFLCLPTQHGVA